MIEDGLNFIAFSCKFTLLGGVKHPTDPAATNQIHTPIGI